MLDVGEQREREVLPTAVQSVVVVGLDSSSSSGPLLALEEEE